MSLPPARVGSPDVTVRCFDFKESDIRCDILLHQQQIEYPPSQATMSGIYGAQVARFSVDVGRDPDSSGWIRPEACEGPGWHLSAVDDRQSLSAHATRFPTPRLR